MRIRWRSSAAHASGDPCRVTPDHKLHQSPHEPSRHAGAVQTAGDAYEPARSRRVVGARPFSSGSSARRSTACGPSHRRQAGRTRSSRRIPRCSTAYLRRNDVQTRLTTSGSVTTSARPWTSRADGPVWPRGLHGIRVTEGSRRSLRTLPESRSVRMARCPPGLLLSPTIQTGVGTGSPVARNVVSSTNRERPRSVAWSRVTRTPLQAGATQVRDRGLRAAGDQQQQEPEIAFDDRALADVDVGVGRDESQAGEPASRVERPTHSPHGRRRLGRPRPARAVWCPGGPRCPGRARRRPSGGCPGS